MSSQSTSAYFRFSSQVLNFGTEAEGPIDVEIWMDSLTSYRLRSGALRARSKFFKASLSPEWWKPENTLHGREDGIKYRYRYSADEESLVVVPPSYQQSEVTGRCPNRVAYVALFAALHRSLTPLDPYVASPAEHLTIRKLQRIIDLAEYFGSLPAIGPSITRFLRSWCAAASKADPQHPSLQPQPDSSKECRFGAYSHELLGISIRIRDADLYRRSFTHFVGKLVLVGGDALWRGADEMQKLEDYQHALKELSPATWGAVVREERRIWYLCETAAGELLEMKLAGRARSVKLVAGEKPPAQYKALYRLCNRWAAACDETRGGESFAAFRRIKELTDDAWRRPEMRPFEEARERIRELISPLFPPTEQTQLVASCEDLYFLCAKAPDALPWTGSKDW